MSNHTLNTWIVENERGMQNFYSIITLVVGLIFLYGSRIKSLSETMSISCFLLGLLLVCIGFVVFIKNTKQIISVNPQKKCIEIETISRFGKKKNLIPFHKILDVYVRELGDKEGGSISYHVILKLKDSKEVALFLGVFEGMFERNTMENYCQRIKQYLDV